MIGRLRGILLEKHPPGLLVEAGGVGYELEAPMTTFYRLPAVGEEVLLHTHLVVREDAQLLYGFSSREDRALFRELIRISGVGAKMALAILSGMSAEDFARCVREGDAGALTRLPGIGKKTAQRLLVEMRDRLAGEVGPAGAPLPAAAPAPGDPLADAVSALVSLGYKPQEASRLVRAVEGGAGLPPEELIRRALKAASGA